MDKREILIGMRKEIRNHRALGEPICYCWAYGTVTGKITGRNTLRFLGLIKPLKPFNRLLWYPMSDYDTRINELTALINTLNP